MRIDLTGWSSKGLRCPDVTVNLLRNGNVPPVSLIQMPNGTGKTTTLELLKAALDGEADEWGADRVRSYKRPRQEEQKGDFVVNLLVDGRPLSFDLTLYYAEGHARYRTSTPGSGGVVAGWKPPPNVRRFLSREFISLFVFDGEFADRLLDSRQSEADRAIDALCQLYILDEIAVIADDAWHDATRLGGPKTQVGLKQYRNQVQTIKARISKVGKAKEEAENEFRGLEYEIKELTESISVHMRSIEGVKNEYENARSDSRDADIKLSEISAKVMQAMRSPCALHEQFGASLKALKAHLDRLKLPENTSAQFFQELLEEENCICGRELNEAARERIQTCTKEYLGSEEAGVINALKHDIDQYVVAATEEGGPRQLKKELTALSEVVREERAAVQKVRILKQSLIAQGDKKLASWEKELEEKSARRDELDGLLKKIASSGDETEKSEQTFSLSLLRKRLIGVKDKISGITKTLKLRWQTQLIREITEEAGEVAGNKIREDLTKEANDRLKVVLSQDPLEIERIDRSIHLRHQTAASVGQTLSVGYTFLMSALNRGQNQFPLVVDSPANPLDAGRRREIGRLIPKLCSQFVGFTISTERMGFVDVLEENVPSINFITIFRKTAGTQHLMVGLPAAGVSETENAILVDGREYFRRFDLKQEPE